MEQSDSFEIKDNSDNPFEMFLMFLDETAVREMSMDCGNPCTF